MGNLESGGQFRKKYEDRDEASEEFSDATAGQERREKLSEDTDGILDEIDEVLEENAEEFVRGYIQKGGQ